MPKLGTYASVIISLILVFNTVTTEATGLNPLDIGKPIFVVPEIDKEPIDITPFSIIKRGNYYADWIISNKTGRIIGYAPWDTSSKRWTLLNMAGEYRGLIYATIGDLKGREHYLLYPEHYLEYLWYDRDNKYTAVMVTSLGGRPKTPERPSGELGGSLLSYRIGNIPLRPVSMPLYIDYAKSPMGIDISIRPRLR